MKFQKTLLAASLAIAAASTVNAAVVVQPAKPVQVTENLFNSNSNASINYTTTTLNGINNVVSAPVHSVYAQNSTAIDTDLNFVLSNGTSAGLPVITNEGQLINLGINNVNGGSLSGKPLEYDVFKYKTTDGKTVFRFQDPETQTYSGYYTEDGTTTNAAGETVTKLTAYNGNNVDLTTLERGGKVAGTSGTTYVTGQENRQLNGEHLVYGYQGGTTVDAGNIDGAVSNPDGGTQLLTADLGSSTTATDIRYVQSGILANTGTGPITDPSKNIYGVSARDNNNVVMMTGNGIALADLSNKGQLQTDGSILSSVGDVGNRSVVNKTRQYDVGGGVKVVEVYNDDSGLASSYYQVGKDGSLSIYNGPAPTVGQHEKTGTAQDLSGLYTISKVHNTVTNKQVKYSEATYKEQQTNIIAGVTNSGADTDAVNAAYQAQKEVEGSRVEQYASNGVIGKNSDNSNKYGFEVVKTDSTGTQKTEITAGGINTTGVINAADYQIGGVSIVENIKGSVDEAVTGATAQFEARVDEKVAQVDTKVAEVDAKIVEVDERLTQFNGTATALNSRVDQLNNRIDDVEKTAYRGVAIALAAQQAIPNLGAGQTAVFGGAGVYESEGAGALGLATVLQDGRTSFSGAIGVAGGGEVGGRVGVAYVFGGK